MPKAKPSKRKPTKFEIIRRAVADYMYTEGCGCCRSADHDQIRERLALLLEVPKYSDGSGRDFNQFRTAREKG